MNPNQAERKPSSPDRSGSHAPLGSVTLGVAAMTLLFAGGAALEARQFFSLTSATNGDIWWHLRTGLWILQNHSVPHSGLFSQSADAPWAAMTWGYDLKLALAYRMFGLGAIPTMLMAFRWALAVMTFVLAGGLRNRFWSALALSAIAEYILSTVPPGPSYYSLLLFAVELLLLRHARESDSVRPLYWLAAVFLVWANLDIQFVYGIALLALFLAALWLQGNKPLARRAGLAVGLCVAATVVTPTFGAAGELSSPALLGRQIVICRISTP